jgi:hypothetical protein
VKNTKFTERIDTPVPDSRFSAYLREIPNVLNHFWSKKLVTSGRLEPSKNERADLLTQKTGS